MWERGVLETTQMADAFQLLRPTNIDSMTGLQKGEDDQVCDRSPNSLDVTSIIRWPCLNFRSLSRRTKSIWC
jgi:hypothetical protein